MTPKEKAQDLINQFLDENNSKQIAQKVCDEVIKVRQNEMIELMEEFNLNGIESKVVAYYFDVKKEIDKL